MSKSSAQDVHANNPDGAVAAYLKKYDMSYSLNGTIDALAIDHNTGSLYTGTGIPTDGFHIADNNTLNVELALREHARFGDQQNFTHAGNADGTADVIATAGYTGNKANWNFDYVVDTGLHGSQQSLNAFTFKLQITQDRTATHTFVLDASTHVWTDEKNPAYHFGGDDFDPHLASATAAGVTNQISENSENPAFLGNAFGTLDQATAAGTVYDIQLEAFQGVKLVGLVHDHVTLEAASSPAT